MPAAADRRLAHQEQECDVKRRSSRRFQSRAAQKFSLAGCFWPSQSMGGYSRYMSSIADVLCCRIERRLSERIAWRWCRQKLGTPVSGAQAPLIHWMNVACQTTTYVREGRCLASLFAYVWRTRCFEDPIVGFRGINANTDIQCQLCARADRYWQIFG